MRGHYPSQVLECHSTKPRRIRELYEALWGYCTQVRGHNPQVSYPSHAAYVNFMKHFWGYCTVPRCKGITRKSPTIVQADIRYAYTLIYEASNPRCEGITRFNFQSWSQPSHVAYVNFMKHLGITYPV